MHNIGRMPQARAAADGADLVHVDREPATHERGACGATEAVRVEPVEDHAVPGLSTPRGALRWSECTLNTTRCFDGPVWVF